MSEARLMITSAVNQIEHAIRQLSTSELDELYAWLAEYQPQAIDTTIEADFSAGRLDGVLQEALADSRSGRHLPL